MIYESVQEFLQWREKEKVHLEKATGSNFDTPRGLYVTSGGFDPLHVGHLRCIQDTVKLAQDSEVAYKQLRPLVVVLVNCDNFLLAKKGYVFMALEDRMEIIDGLKGIDGVIPVFYKNDDFTVTDVLNELKPSHFTKGGDRKDETSIPEWELCMKINCKVITGVGGHKIRSSSTMVENADRFNLEAIELEGWAKGYGEGRSHD
jgi:D-beta-D-heptose 7-phosphate kinase/D-beta-D-heptose 1-phosphate adenosyltransferase